ncbi:MAG: zinc ABC transporter substrate-binding protein [Methanolinea sp.]|jgi:zinc transport system substrate-binding protein|nr:zinc ABC transporter substrate-binding protein [Methanolinea sp.]
MIQCRRRRPWIWLCILGVLAVCSACCIEQDAKDDSRLQVVVTILPQAEMATSIGGERTCVTVVVPPGVEPHTYEPSAAQLVQISRADMYLRLGPGLLPFEDTLVERIRALNPEILIVDTSDGISLIHGKDGEPDDSHGPDPHIWLSPSGLRIMAAHMERGYAEIDPGHQVEYAARKERYLHDVEDADRSVRNALSGMEGEPFLVFHPAWGYFAREYSLIQVAVETEGKEPSAKELSTLITLARERGIRVVFAEPQFSTRGSEVIAREINGTVVLIDPLAPDTLANLQRVAFAISGTYGDAKTEVGH